MRRQAGLELVTAVHGRRSTYRSIDDLLLRTLQDTLGEAAGAERWHIVDPLLLRKHCCEKNCLELKVNGANEK